MGLAGESRIEAARQRVRTARLAIAAVAVAAFVGLFAVARVSHPGSGDAPPSGDSSSPVDDDQSFAFGFGDGSIGPSSGDGAPSLQTGSS